MLPVPFDHFFQLAVKVSFILGAFIYLIFAFIVVKQTTMMSKNVNDKFNTILIAFSYLHLLAAILLVILTLMVL